MLPEFRREPKSFPDLLNYFALVDEGVLFNKDGSLLSGWWYGGPDMESATPNEMDANTSGMTIMNSMRRKICPTGPAT